MKADRREDHVLWHCSQLSSSEHGSLVDDGEGRQFSGVVVAPLDGVPCHISYEVVVDREWTPQAVVADVSTPGRHWSMALRAGPAATWMLDGTPAPDLDGCGDVDLGWTPATNTIPIRRLALEIGETAAIGAAWVRFPELDVVASEQCYTRLTHDRWRYQSGEYDFELCTDMATGLVLSYGEDLWRATAVATNSQSL